MSSSVDTNDGGFLLLASQALCIPMCPDRAGTHKLADVRPADRMSGPMTIPLSYSGHSDGDDIIHITKAEADRLGFKIIIQYFT